MRARAGSILLAVVLWMSGCAQPGGPDGRDVRGVVSPNPGAYRTGAGLFSDTFGSLEQWRTELEAGGTVRAVDHVLDVDTPKGCTVWFTHELMGPVMIRYEARLVRGDPAGANERVSDLNCFWMASDPRAGGLGSWPAGGDFFSVPARTGAFATYNQLRTYYVGQGGNTNTTTRFRRYIGDATNRPLLPEHDLSGAADLLTANVWQTVTLVACDQLIEYYRDGRRVFSYVDPTPYTHGYFGIRTTQNHLQIRNVEIFRLTPAQP